MARDRAFGTSTPKQMAKLKPEPGAPLSIATDVASLVLSTTKVVKQCNDFRSKLEASRRPYKRCSLHFNQSLYQVQHLLQAQGNVLTRIAQRAFSLRESRSPANTRTDSGPDTTEAASISNLTTTPSAEFSFDNEIVNARAYRNAYQNYNRAIKEKRVPARNKKVSPSTATDLVEPGDDGTLKAPSISRLSISDNSMFSLGSTTDLNSLFQRKPTQDESQEDAEPPADNESDATTLVEKEKKHKALFAKIRAQVLAERKLATPDKAARPRISDVPTLLHAAAYGDRLDLAKKYLESDLDPNILHGQWSPLNLAIQSENIPMVKLLLSHGADVEFVRPEKRYPLVNACQMGNGQIINLLLEHGADPSTVTAAGVTSLIAAIRHDNPTIVEPLLLKGALPDTQANEAGFTALHMAASDDQEKIIKLLMRCGASPEVMCAKFRSALHIAAIKGHVEAAKLLLKAGVEVDAVGGEESQTALHQSMRNSQKEVTDLLLQFGANPDARDAKDIPVWHRAIQAERADVLEMLLWKTARPTLILENTYTKIKMTGLQIAALRGNPSVVAVLLKMGANPTNKGVKGYLPLALAQNEETRGLRKNAADTWSPQSKE